MKSDKSQTADRSLSKKDNNCEHVVFGYFSMVSMGWDDRDYGDFSIEIYPSGKLIYKTYLFSGIEKSKTEYSISIHSVQAIKAVIEKYQADIDSFDQQLRNGTDDGTGDYFIFEGKKLITWNIQHTSKFLIMLEEVRRKVDPNYPDYPNGEWLAALKQENKILSIFSKIVQILKEEAIFLRLGEVKFDKDERTSDAQ